MSDHVERACFKCGSLIHHVDDCPIQPIDSITGQEPQELSYEDGRDSAKSLSRNSTLDEWSNKTPQIGQRISTPLETPFGPTIFTCVPEPVLTWSTGTIRTFLPEKGFGFITPNDNGLEVWFHSSDKTDRQYEPQTGDTITYLTRFGEKGTLVAREVSLVANSVSVPRDYKEPAIQNIYQILYEQDNYEQD